MAEAWGEDRAGDRGVATDETPRAKGPSQGIENLIDGRGTNSAIVFVRICIKFDLICSIVMCSRNYPELILKCGAAIFSHINKY